MAQPTRRFHVAISVGHPIRTHPSWQFWHRATDLPRAAQRRPPQPSYMALDERSGAGGRKWEGPGADRTRQEGSGTGRISGVAADPPGWSARPPLPRRCPRIPPCPLGSQGRRSPPDAGWSASWSPWHGWPPWYGQGHSRQRTRSHHPLGEPDVSHHRRPRDRGVRRIGPSGPFPDTPRPSGRPIRPVCPNASSAFAATRVGGGTIHARNRWHGHAQLVPGSRARDRSGSDSRGPDPPHRVPARRSPTAGSDHDSWAPSCPGQPRPAPQVRSMQPGHR